MNRWLQVSPDSWRKEADLPIGHAVAEIQKRDTLPIYQARIEVTFAQKQIPQHMVKTTVGLPSQAEAELACNRFLAEIVAAATLKDCTTSDY